jgi:hypothetical protein
MSEKTDRIRRELERIAHANGGVLMPLAVVDAARPPSSPLHSRFEWNNTEAAEKYRLWQARQLIAITVSVIGDSREKEQVWVSLKSDRVADGGYRGLVAVLSDSEMRAQLLQDALEDMRVFETKYRHLQELAEVFAAIRKHTKRRKAA